MQTSFHNITSVGSCDRSRGSEDFRAGVTLALASFPGTPSPSLGWLPPPERPFCVFAGLLSFMIEETCPKTQQTSPGVSKVELGHRIIPGPIPVAKRWPRFCDHVG